LSLDEKSKEEIIKEKSLSLKMRYEKQPFNFSCAGSVFKNPPTTYAGKVLEESGCKGLRFGDAIISDKHANFIVNLGNATAQDVVNLIREAQLRVYKTEDLVLELEIKLLGEFKNLNLIERKNEYKSSGLVWWKINRKRNFDQKWEVSIFSIDK